MPPCGLRGRQTAAMGLSTGPAKLWVQIISVPAGNTWNRMEAHIFCRRQS